MDVWQYIERESLEVPVDLLRPRARRLPARRHVAVARATSCRNATGRGGRAHGRALPDGRRHDLHRRGRLAGRERRRTSSLEVAAARITERGATRADDAFSRDGDGRPQARGLLLDGPAALLHRRLGRRRQEHAHRPAAVRLQGHLRGPARGDRAHQPAARLQPGRPGAADRRPARRARAGHHHRRRLSLLRDAAAQVHHRGHARATSSTPATWSPAPRPRTSRSSSSTRARASSSSRAATRSSRRCWASRTSSSRSTRWTSSATSEEVFEQHPRRLLRLGRRSSTSTTSSSSRSRALHGDNVVHALAVDALVPGAVAALPPRARLHRLRSEPHRRALPGPVGHPAADRRAPRLPRLCRPGRGGRVPQGRRGGRPAVGQDARASRASRRSTASSRRPRRRMSVVDPARGRHRHLARRHDLPARTTSRRSPTSSRRWCAGWPTRRCATGGRYLLKHTTRTVQGGRRRPALPHRRQHAPPRPGRGRARPQRDRPGAPAHERPLLLDSVRPSRTTGGFILIDEATQDTVGAGMVISAGPEQRTCRSATRWRMRAKTTQRSPPPRRYRRRWWRGATCSAKALAPARLLRWTTTATSGRTSPTTGTGATRSRPRRRARWPTRRAFCLSPSFPTCPIFQDWAARAAARPVPAPGGYQGGRESAVAAAMAGIRGER